MLQLVYISTARQAPSASELESILAVSRRNNGRCGVTGLLVAGGRRFLQALEGPEDAVLATFARIQADARHFALVRLACTPIAEQCFGDWSMGFEAGGPPGSGGDLNAVVEGLVSPLRDRNLRAQFITFAALHATAA
jgi:hypothetical protein